MKKIIKKAKNFYSENENLDIRGAKAVSKYFLNNRLKIYFLVFLFILPNIILRVPYLNLYSSAFIESTRFIFYYALVILLAGFKRDILFKISIFSFPVLALLILLRKEDFAQTLADAIFLLILTAVIISLAKNKNELQK